MSIFKPDFRFEKITDIKTEILLEHKIKIVLLDADNTLSFHGSKEPFPGVPEWLEEIRNCGIVPVIISNNSECRIKPFAKKLGLDYVKAKSPFRKVSEPRSKNTVLNRRIPPLSATSFLQTSLAENFLGQRFF